MFYPELFNRRLGVTPLFLLVTHGDQLCSTGARHCSFQTNLHLQQHVLCVLGALIRCSFSSFQQTTGLSWSWNSWWVMFEVFSMSELIRKFEAFSSSHSFPSTFSDDTSKCEWTNGDKNTTSDSDHPSTSYEWSLCAFNFTDKFRFFLSDCQQALNTFRLC